MNKDERPNKSTQSPKGTLVPRTKTTIRQTLDTNQPFLGFSRAIWVLPTPDETRKQE